MINSDLDILNLRILVAALGEIHHAAWWKSRFLSSVGLSHLERVYPRTSFAAAVSSASRAACAMHDAAIGRGAVFHLFRLPRQTERAIETALRGHNLELEVTYRTLLPDRTALWGALANLARDAQPQPATGPVKLSAKARELAPKLAVAYLQAFQAGNQIYPYFEQ